MSCLIDELKAIPDHRKARRKRHPLWVLLLLILMGMLAGYRDRLQLKGRASDYRIGSTNPGLPKGIVLYHTRQAQHELIAIIQSQDSVVLANQKFV